MRFGLLVVRVLTIIIIVKLVHDNDVAGSNWPYGETAVYNIIAQDVVEGKKGKGKRWLSRANFVASRQLPT